MNDESNGLSGAGIIVPVLIALVLVGAVGGVVYQGPMPFGRQHPTLHDAVGAGNMKDVIFYIDEDPNLIKSRDSHGELPIHHAVKYRQMDALKLLVDQGADVDMQVPRSGDTPLHYAVMVGDEEAIKFLLTSGADFMKKNDHGETPVEFARTHTYSNVDKIIQVLEKAEKESPNKPDAGDGL